MIFLSYIDLINATLSRYSSNASYLKKLLILMIRAEVVAQVEECQTTNQEVPSLNLRWELGFFYLNLTVVYLWQVSCEGATQMILSQNA